ncbi:unnamed protein product, partial [marine sediment metagenome]
DIEDSSKNWMDDELGEDYLVGLYVMSHHGTGNYRKLIYCHTESTFAIATNIAPVVDQNYYMFSFVPYVFTGVLMDTTILEMPRFEQVHFYNSQLYGFGYQVVDPNGIGNIIDSVFYNRIWYSHPAMPFYTHQQYHDNVGGNEDITVLFGLRNNLYIGTDKSIWYYSGIPRLKNQYGDAMKSKVVSNNNIPDIDNWAKATEEYGYFTNRTGVYRFDGVRPQKISWDIDPIIRANYGSRIVMGYFPAEQKLLRLAP